MSKNLSLNCTLHKNTRLLDSKNLVVRAVHRIKILYDWEGVGGGGGL